MTVEQPGSTSAGGVARGVAGGDRQAARSTARCRYANHDQHTHRILLVGLMFQDGASRPVVGGSPGVLVWWRLVRSGRLEEVNAEVEVHVFDLVEVQTQGGGQI
ncbi:hypothetical protein SMC26_13980 [Actinomadura fulvescens]|uniref:Uncharacterized protein n=1 Tax=Actinomadura fulvescens TaxID=46160 RepID=A0ABN3Q2A5_9ACTN